MTVATAARRRSLNWASTSPAADILLAAAPPPPAAGAGGKEEEEDHTFISLCHRKALLLPLTLSPNPTDKFTSITLVGSLPCHSLGIIFPALLPYWHQSNHPSLLLSYLWSHTPEDHCSLHLLKTASNPAWSSLHVGWEMPCLILCMLTHSYL